MGSSVLFLLQTAFTLLGSDAYDGTVADFDGNLDNTAAPFQLFSLRNLINFLMGFGWTGAGLFFEIENKNILIALSAFVGIVFILLFFFLIDRIIGFTEDNTININKLIGRVGDVYLNIPENMSGKGKIQISYNGSSRELSAMTRSEEPIYFGTSVKVDDIEDGILIVSKI
jgi:membrane protein implicated in regulation of membrane protease activity